MEFYDPLLDSFSGVIFTTHSRAILFDLERLVNRISQYG